MKTRIINAIVILLATGYIMSVRWDEASSNIAVTAALLIELAIAMLVAVKLEKFREKKGFSLKPGIVAALLIILEIIILAAIVSYGWPAADCVWKDVLPVVVPVVLIYYAICAVVRKKRAE